MKYDEFAFVNQQLAGMLKSGIPLEGALRQLCSAMQRGTLRQEFELLEADLAKGVPITQAVDARKLPEFYIQMIKVGVQGNDLPAILTLLADYYQRMNFLWTRLKGLMVYPLIVLVATLGLSLLLIKIYNSLGYNALGIPFVFSGNGGPFEQYRPVLWMTGLMLPPIFIGILTCMTALFLFVPKFRQRVSWYMPGFREAYLGRLASSLNLMLKSGCNLQTALGLLRQMENGTPMEAELAHWQSRVAAGYGKFNQMVSGRKIIPPLFQWMVSSEGEDWVTGLTRAAETYYQRAAYRTELMLNAALPVSVLFLGGIIVMQIISVIGLASGGLGIIGMLKMLGD